MPDWLNSLFDVQGTANDVANQAVGNAVGNAVQTYAPIALIGGGVFLVLVFLAAHGGRR